MIAFNKELLENSILMDKAKELNYSGFISKEQLNSIKNELPILKSQNNWLIRIGFFILGSLLYSSITGVLSMVFMELIQSNYGWGLFANAIIGFVGCEFFSKMKFYNYGLDNAFILWAQIALIAGFGVLTESFLVSFIAMSFIGFICCLRYINAFSALMSCVGIVGFFCTLIIEEKIIPMLYLPFVLFLLAIGLYFFYIKMKNTQVVNYYKNAFHLIQGFSLILGYFSMNYLVVRELSEELMGIKVTPGHDIPFALFFYVFTFLIPILYIIYALRNKDKTMLIIGFLTFTFSIYTIRYYYNILPIELALTFGGILLFGITYFVIEKLKNKDSGITFKPARGNDKNALSNIQALIINSQVDLNPTENNQDMPFGGGGFSGGGSDGSF